MRYWFISAKTELRALVCGWLAVAMLLSASFAPTGFVVPLSALDQQIALENCLSSHGADGQDHQDRHVHDCCLPGLGAAQILPGVALVTETDAPLAVPPLEAALWQAPVSHPHLNAQAVPRGPPASLFA